MEKPLANTQHVIKQDAWIGLKTFTHARIALGRTGHAIPLAENLHFKADHARARDAVYAALDEVTLAEALQAMAPHLPVLLLQSQAASRQAYLQRPDKGRRLNEASALLVSKAVKEGNYHVSIILADGLSAQAVQLHAPGVLRELLGYLNTHGFTIAPISIATQARVAICDEIGSLLRSTLTLILIGERPGLSSPHSMGIYITYRPYIGNTDESRNCISNIHPSGGLQYHEAALQAFNLIKDAFALQLTGVHLKSHKVLE